nr:unnamed protein product [Spirometra erinaceieuropaei]
MFQSVATIVESAGNWTLSNATTRISTYIAAGSDAYSILASAGIYTDPLVGLNDIVQRFISYQNWNFTHLFHVSPPSGSQLAVLVLDELDTFCCVWLNGHLIRCTTNSFRRHHLNISPYLKPGEWNKLELAFESTPRVARSLAQQIARQSLYVPPPSCWPETFHGECHVNLVRTTQASFGWDWGPAFPIQGFWRIPQIRFFQVAAWLGEGLKFYPSLLRSKWQGNLWTADVVVEVLVHASSPILCLQVKLADLMSLPKKNCFLPRWQSRGNLSVEIPVRLFAHRPNVQEWWPNGIESGPRVYDLHVQLMTADGLQLDEASYQVGFREVELVEQPIQLPSKNNLSDFGSTFYFKLNGLPVFAKGSNWVPQKLLPGRHPGFYRAGPNTTSPEQDLELGPMEEVLRSAAMVGTNMLRVWGGGRYESHHFYDQASRLGIMIWQDMMFACATYTLETGTGEDFIGPEIRRQIKRLHHHPSIVVWAANNEVELAIAADWYPYSPELRKQYKAVFLERVSTIVREEEAKPPWPWTGSESYRPRKCLLSSPSNGQRSEERGGVDTNPQDPLIGDVHFYQYDGDLWNEEVYPLTRFTSEFGIQSLPSPLAWLRSLEGAGSPDDWKLEGQLMLHRQHSTVGMAGMLGPSLQVMHAPVDVDDPIMNFSRWAYLTQLNQALAYKTHINFLERHKCFLQTPQGNRSRLFPVGQGLSMGALYWQLNDLWAAPTWSTVDAAGQWKIAHYLAANATFQVSTLGRIVMAVERKTSVKVVQVDWLAPIGSRRAQTPAYVDLTCRTIRSFQVGRRIHRRLLRTDRRSSVCPQRLFEAPLSRLSSACGCTPDSAAECILVARLYNAETEVSEVLQLGRPKDIGEWPRRAGVMQVTAEVSNASGNTSPPFRPSQCFRITITPSSPELFVWMLLDPRLQVDGWFAENGFHLLEDGPRSVEFFVKGGPSMTPETLEKSLIVISLASLGK